jgi:hypothetical protein
LEISGMAEDYRTVCPIPHVGYCVRECGNFWDEVRQECSEPGCDDHAPLEDHGLSGAYGLCAIYWAEDAD